MIKTDWFKVARYSFLKLLKAQFKQVYVASNCLAKRLNNTLRKTHLERKAVGNFCLAAVAMATETFQNGRQIKFNRNYNRKRVR